MLSVIFGILIPFVGTIFGATLVFFIKDKINENLYKILMGFAAGVMIAASIWSLLIPAISQGEQIMKVGWLPAIIGLIFGFLFLIALDYFNNKIKKNINEKKSLLIMSITVHNIPEGMAVGVALAGAFYGYSLLSITSAIILAVGIAIQNIPEGAIVSIPSRLKGNSKHKSFFIGVLSGIVEPIFAFITFFITGIISSILPFVLSFAAGSMLFVVMNEIIPENSQSGNILLSTIGFAIGFVLMLILDVSLV